MGLGETIGFSTLATQNNTGNYDFNNFPGIVSIGLMGDPTLRMHIVAPPRPPWSSPPTSSNGVNLVLEFLDRYGAGLLCVSGRRPPPARSRD